MSPPPGRSSPPTSRSLRSQIWWRLLLHPPVKGSSRHQSTHTALELLEVMGRDGALLRGADTLRVPGSAARRAGGEWEAVKGAAENPSWWRALIRLETFII